MAELGVMTNSSDKEHEARRVPPGRIRSELDLFDPVVREDANAELTRRHTLCGCKERVVAQRSGLVCSIGASP